MVIGVQLSNPRASHVQGHLIRRRRSFTDLTVFTTPRRVFALRHVLDLGS